VIAVRTCPICGAPLSGHRCDARYCGSACRAEAWRLRRLLDGETVGPYESVSDRLRSWGSRGAGRLDGDQQSRS